MKLLLDTHTFIWFVENDDSLPSNLKSYIEDAQNEIFVSIASLWEIAIKVSLGKLELGNSLPTLINQIEANGFMFLPILPQHTIYVSSLPFYHRDPFDRLLIAQSCVDDFILVSKDNIFKEYEVKCVWANL